MATKVQMTSVSDGKTLHGKVVDLRERIEARKAELVEMDGKLAQVGVFLEDEWTEKEMPGTLVDVQSLTWIVEGLEAQFAKPKSASAHAREKIEDCVLAGVSVPMTTEEIVAWTHDQIGAERINTRRAIFGLVRDGQLQEMQKGRVKCYVKAGASSSEVADLCRQVTDMRHKIESRKTERAELSRRLARIEDAEGRAEELSELQADWTSLNGIIARMESQLAGLDAQRAASMSVA